MANIVRFHPLVAADLSGAAAYYDKISIDVGNRFRNAVKERVETIKARPEIYGRIHKEIRAARVNRFPYVVVFEHDGGTPQFLGVFHAASDHAKWIERFG